MLDQMHANDGSHGLMKNQPGEPSQHPALLAGASAAWFQPLTTAADRSRGLSAEPMMPRFQLPVERITDDQKNPYRRTTGRRNAHCRNEQFHHRGCRC